MNNQAATQHEKPLNGQKCSRSGSPFCSLPFYDSGGITLYCGDAWELLPRLALEHNIEAVATDPPYPDIDKGFEITPIDVLGTLRCRQFVFWSAVEPFPMTWTAVHIWHKPNGNSSQHYERVFERNGKRTCRVFRVAAILPNYVQYKHECVDHPTQKPLKLMRQIIGLDRAAVWCDPFAGSGTTLVAAKLEGKRAIGIERDERYCEIAANRLAQGVLF